MVNGLSLASKTNGFIRHQTTALGGSDRAAEVGLSTRTKLAFFTFGCVQGNDVITYSHVRHTLTDRFNNTATFMTQNSGKDTFGVYCFYSE